MFGFGAINGLVTIVKATLPLELFSTERYASRTGLLLIRGQLMAAASPFAYAWLNKSLGITGGMWVSAGLTLVIAGSQWRSCAACANKLYRTVSRALR